MQKQFIFFSLFAFLAFTNLAEAGEIHYGHIEDVHGSDIHIQYKGPWGEQHFLCSVDTLDCTDFGTTAPTLFPEIAGSTSYPNSHNGGYGVTEEVGEEGVTYRLYNVSSETAEEVAVLPYTKETVAYKFPWADDHLMLFATDGTVSTYDIVSGEMTEFTPDQSDFPLRSLSPHATYLAAYNYLDEAHKVWDTATGEELSIPSQTPAYVEFSQDERYAAYVDDPDGYQTLYLVDLKREELKAARLFKDDFTIEDYLWFKDSLYAIGNTQDDPYRWVLYQYDPATRKTKIIAEDVSYGDYLRAIGETALSFLVIEGKNSHVALYQPETDRVDVLRPVADSKASTEITRTMMEFDDGVMGVLYAPEQPDRSPDLYVWLHGGPKRQTSLGYHSYLSYAVYDELLEKLAESGAYVLKLDYPGSYGHGSEYMDQLTHQLGEVDVEGVMDATQDIQRKFRINDTYLIGNSYGGYLGPKVLIENQSKFDGVIAINGVFDWFDLIARIPSSPFTVYFDGEADLVDLDTNFDLYERASIVSQLPKLNKKKDLLLIYGEDDATVPTWQTKEFFYQAKALGKNVDLLTLTGEDHIIRQRDSLNKLCSFIADGLTIKDLNCK